MRSDEAPRRRPAHAERVPAERDQRLPDGRRAGRRRHAPFRAAHLPPARRPQGRRPMRSRTRIPTTRAPAARCASGSASSCGAASATRTRWRAATSARRTTASTSVITWAWAGPPYPVARRLREGDEVAGFTVLDVPGHSPGHVAYWRESDRTLIAGDVLNNMNIMTGITGLHEPRVEFTTDPALNRESARRLGALEPALVVLRPRAAAARHAQVRRSSPSRCRADDARSRRLHRPRDHGLAHGGEPRARRVRADRLEPHRLDGGRVGRAPRRRGRRLAAGAGVEQRRRDHDGGRRRPGRVRAARRRGRGGSGRGPAVHRHVDDRPGARRGGSATRLAGARRVVHGRAGDRVVAEGRGRDADDHGGRRASATSSARGRCSRRWASWSCTSGRSGTGSW